MQTPLLSQELVADLNHQINSPLAAIRNALYLVACRTSDPAILRYLDLAEEEVAAISAALQQARSLYDTSPARRPGPVLVSRRAAA